ncbi:MAG TPA: DUF4350 domain-containing protein [Blastocatellia bacterium]|nr:DUF4350 domain-containing protein [Blastocatellia bacterium]
MRETRLCENRVRAKHAKNRKDAKAAHGLHIGGCSAFIFQMKTRHHQVIVAVLTLALCGSAQQVADPDFDTRVAKPAYTQKHPRVLFDEAHNNFHTSTGRYKPFADLLGSDGYSITPNKQKLTSEALRGFDVLVISNALGAPLMGTPEASNPAFTEEECDAIRDWVRAGGSLLLIADHAPMGAAAEKLSLRFGVEMSKGYTADPSNYDVESNNQGFIKYNRGNNGLGQHPILEGRNPSERIDNVIAFTGQSLKGPEGSVAFMKLASTAVDVTPKRGDTPQSEVSAAGRAQGIALTIGKGRVVVLGEAAMLSAQLAGPQKVKFGMNKPGTDNRQLALNIMHWLSRLIGS